MTLTAIILMGIILLVLIGILINNNNYFSEFQEYSKSIHGNLYDSKQALQLIAGRTITLTESIERIQQTARDIKFLHENLEKHEIKKSINTIENIDVNLMDLKYLQDTLSSIERSVEIIISHPAFTTHGDDDSLPSW